VALYALLATACAQASGEVCQLDGDCESGMYCCKPTAAEDTNPTVRGVCRASMEACIASRVMDSGTRDAQVDSGSDAGSDSGFSAVGDDCVRLDGAGEDAGPPFCFSGLECFRGLGCVEPEGTPPIDAGTGSGADAGADAGSDAGQDAGSDAGQDAGGDAGLDGGP
jgi:hypothetical protein